MAAGGFAVREIPLLNKLPSQKVITVFQDSDGEIWIGTEDGLCRNNGYNIKVYRPSDCETDPSPDSRINAVCEHSPGEIWFGTPSGLYSVSKSSRRVRSVDSKNLKDRNIDCICKTSDGSTWVGVAASVMRYGSDGSLKSIYAIRWHNSPAQARKLCQDSRNNLWMTVSGGGICRFNENTDKWEEYPWPFREDACCLVEERNSGTLYIGTWLKGIVRFNPNPADGEEMFISATEPIQKDERQDAIISLEQDDSNGYIWAATMCGLNAFRIMPDGRLSRIEVPAEKLPPYQMITDIMKDRDGLIWVAGYNVPSFVVFPATRFSNYPLPEVSRQSGHISTISSVCHDSSDPSLLWVFQERHRLYLYDTRKNRAVSEIRTLFEKTNNNLGNISHLVAVRGKDRGGVWALSHSPEMVCRLSYDNGSIYVAEKIPLPEKPGTLNTVSDCGNGTVAIGSSEGLYLYSGGRLTITGKGYSVEEITGRGSELYALCHIPRSGNRFIAEISGNSFRKIVDVPSGTTSVTPDRKRENVFWTGDNRGEICKIVPGKNPRLLSRHSDYFPSGSIQSLFTDSCGKLWVQTEQNLTEISFSDQQLNRYKAADAEINLFNFFPHSNCILPTGEVIFGGTGGLCRCKSSGTRIPSREKKLIITEITVDEEPVDIPQANGTLTIPGDCQSVNIEFAIPDCFNASRTVYAYRLNDGKDSEWIRLPAGYNVVHLAHLPKGVHNFEVKRISWDDMNREAAITPLRIFREPKFYESAWFVSFMTILVFICGFLLFRAWGRYKARVANRKMEEELIRLKFNFFTNITHELRTPLSLIITPLDTLINREENPQSRIELENIQRNAEDLLSLINRILNFRKLEVGSERFNPGHGNIVEFAEQVASNFSSLASKKGIDFRFSSYCDTLMTSFDADKLKIIINNLLGNALKFTDTGGTVRFILEKTQVEEKNFLILKFTDTGRGIAQNNIPHVLDAFYQEGGSVAADGTAGSGIGLYLVKKYVEMHGGTISIKSKQTVGTEIAVSIPLGEAKNEEDRDNGPEVEFIRDSRKKLVLITEDNEEFRSFLYRELSLEYDVIEAADGEQGLRMARKHFPDVIVSDVMMPKVNGFTFCREIKSDPVVCDIPFILLTARIDDTSRMEGFESKADSYLTKPFKLEMLFNRINYLIESRARRQSEYMTEPDASAEKLRLNPLDEQMIEKVIECVNRNLDNSEYSIAELSSDMNMSRMNLYRKIMSVTGQTPTEFVRTLRLKKAAAMLVEGKYSVVEIADATGFSSPSYFARIFKAQFGMTPSQYADKNRYN